MLSEVSQLQKSIHCLIPFKWHSRKIKTILTEIRPVGIEEGDWERGRGKF